jgi:hypothetical protein
VRCVVVRVRIWSGAAVLGKSSFAAGACAVVGGYGEGVSSTTVRRRGGEGGWGIVPRVGSVVEGSLAVGWWWIMYGTPCKVS